MSTPWAIDVEGVRLPKQLSGHPALELCNSRAGWQGAPDPRGDYLQSYDALALLAVTSGLLTADAGKAVRRMAVRHTEAAARMLERTRVIRKDLYTAFTSQPGPTVRRRLSTAISAAHSRQRLAFENDSARWEFGGSPALVDPLDAFLVAAGDLLVDERGKHVSACPGEDCGWLFVNTSGRRRWCQMAVCGNRAKQNAFAERAQSTHR